MTGRIVVFGATGYTGHLVAEALVRRGARPVLAGRSAGRLRELATSLGDLDTAVADVADAASVNALVERGDVLVATVGPFARWGAPGVAAALSAGAGYLDSTGEPSFVRQVFETWGPMAEQAGVGLLTAFGYDYVPGNLAGALALREAGPAAVRVDVGYFTTGDVRGGVSSGTLASLAGAMADPGFAWRDGAIVTERGAAHSRSFHVDGEKRDGVSVGGSEHFALPRLAPALREVGVYLGWSGAAGPTRALSAAGSAASRVPGVQNVLRRAAAAVPLPQGRGPDAATRARSGSHVVAVASDSTGAALSEVHLAGANGYTFTAEILAWAAQRAASGGVRGTGALGPVEAFGVEGLTAGCESAGLQRVGPVGQPQ